MANDDETAMEQWVSGRDDLELEEDGSITNTETGSNTREDDNTPDTSQKQSNSQSDAKSKQSQRSSKSCSLRLSPVQFVCRQCLAGSVWIWRHSGS